MIFNFFIIYVLFQIIEANNEYLEKKESITLNIPINENKTITLNLIRDPTANESLSIFSLNKTDWLKRRDKHVGWYREEYYDAFFSVSFEKNEKFEFFGSFDYNLQDYKLVPKHSSLNLEEEKGENKTININGTDYLLIEIDKLYLLGLMTFKGDTDIPDTRHSFSMLKGQNVTRTKGNKGEVLHAEMFIVIDFSLFKMWKSYCKDDENKTIETLRGYYAHVINGVGIRFANINDKDLNIQVHILALYICTNESQASFIENYVEDNKTLNYHGVIRSFQVWLREQLKNNKIPWYDVAAVFTRYNHPEVVGVGLIATMCYSNAIMLGYEFGFTNVIDVAAHELGHIFGATHDGDGNICSSKSQYIMATTGGNTIERTRFNPTHFSHCSIDSIKYWMNKLDEDNLNCLLDGPRTNISEFLESSNKMAGEIYSLDEQCQMTLGDKSFHCGGGGFFEYRMCQYIYCYDVEQERCIRRFRSGAVDGSPCGDKKWCYNGMCQYNINAPETNKTCLYGDHKVENTFEEGNVTYNCSDLWKPHLTYKCKEPYFQSYCCQTCDDIWQYYSKFYINDCEYGDNVANCEKQLEQLSSHCFDPDTPISRICCFSCLNYTNKNLFDDVKKNHKKIPYKKRIFNRNLQPIKLEPLDNKFTLEKFCGNFKNEPTGFKFNETTLLGCEDLESSYSWLCYRYEALSSCCKTCFNVYQKMAQKGILGCLYGDKAPWCINYLKRNHTGCFIPGDRVGDLCCQSCDQYIKNKEHSEAHPTRHDKCLTKDKTEYIPYKNNTEKIKCNQLSTKPHLCYYKLFTQSCCETCEDLRLKLIDLNLPRSCKYGDRIKDCSSMNANTCKDEKQNLKCCKTCLEKNCEDESWCEDYLKKENNFCSEELAKRCCRSCRYGRFKDKKISF